MPARAGACPLSIELDSLDHGPLGPLGDDPPQGTAGSNSDSAAYGSAAGGQEAEAELDLAAPQEPEQGPLGNFSHYSSSEQLPSGIPDDPLDPATLDNLLKRVGGHGVNDDAERSTLQTTLFPLSRILLTAHIPTSPLIPALHPHHQRHQPRCPLSRWSPPSPSACLS